MKSVLFFTASGPLVLLTSHETVTDVSFIEKLRIKGIEKFIAYELPLENVRQYYGGHFTSVVNDLHQDDDLRVLDFSGDRIFKLFNLNELGAAMIFDHAFDQAA